MRLKNIYLLLFSLILLTSCRKDEMIFLSDSSTVSIPTPSDQYRGFYLLNEGTMGMNRASIDLFEYDSGVYTRDIFSERNPNITKELGDVGNDIQIYGKKVYATINVSNFVEVFDVETGKHIKQIHVPNCRYLKFKDGKAYVSSYSGKVEINPKAYYHYIYRSDSAVNHYTENRFKQEYHVAESFEKLMKEWDKSLEYKDLINKEYWNTIYLELKNLSSKECLLKKEEKTCLVKKMMENKKIESAVTDLSTQVEKNKFVKILLILIKKKNYSLALSVMSLRMNIGGKSQTLLNSIKRLGYKKGVKIK